MAQQTRTTLLSNLLVLFPNNATEFITPAKLREGLTNMIDSGLITLTDDSDDITEGISNLFLTTGERAKLGNVPANTNQDLSDLNSAIVALQGSLIPQGSWNASTNTPDITGTTETGYYWIVSDAGSTSLGGITDWEVNDWAIKTSTGWAKVDNTDSVLTVAGRTGNIVLDAQDIAEAGNRIWLLSGAQTISGNKTFSSPVTMNNTLTLDANLLGDQSARIYRPVGTAISASANLEDLDPNTFYDVDASGGAVVITLTDAANSAFAIGTEFEFSPIDLTNDVSFIGSGSQTIESKDLNLKLDGVFSGSVLKKTAANTWRLIGTLKL